MPSSPRARMVALATALVLFAGCESASTPPVVDISPPADATRPTEAPAPSTDTAPAPANPATVALLNDSAVAGAAGDHQRAIGYLERAIRIAPRDPELWVALAREHVAQSEWQSGIQHAQKAITLAARRVDLVRDAWLVIADAEEGLGNRREARRIRAEWRSARG